MLEIGIQAPDFELPDQDGVMHKLSDYKGKKVILYFYPKDNTAGCTKQAWISFRKTTSLFCTPSCIIFWIKI